MNTYHGAVRFHLVYVQSDRNAGCLLYSIVDGLPTPEFGFDLEFIAARDGEPLKVILATKRRDDRGLWEVLRTTQISFNVNASHIGRAYFRGNEVTITDVCRLR